MPSASISALPMMLLIGVRSSWLTVETKSSLTLVEVLEPGDDVALAAQRLDQDLLAAAGVGDVAGHEQVAEQVAEGVGDRVGGHRDLERRPARRAARSSRASRGRGLRPRGRRSPRRSRCAAARDVAGEVLAGDELDQLAAGGARRRSMPEHVLGAGVEQRDPAARGRCRRRRSSGPSAAGGRPCPAFSRASVTSVAEITTVTGASGAGLVDVAGEDHRLRCRRPWSAAAPRRCAGSCAQVAEQLGGRLALVRPVIRAPTSAGPTSSSSV